jgi:hypothetical protein
MFVRDETFLNSLVDLVCKFLFVDGLADSNNRSNGSFSIYFLITRTQGELKRFRFMEVVCKFSGDAIFVGRKN